MQKILVKVEKRTLVFNKYEKKIQEVNLNNTNIISNENLIFTDEYIAKNNELVSAFLKIIVLKNKIEEIHIQNHEISLTVLSLIHNISTIKKIYFEENINLNYTIVEPIINNPNIEYVNCYYMPEFLFEQLTKYNNCIVELRNEIFTLSDFMEYNHLKTYSDIYYKKKIIIKKKLELSDKEDIDNFLAINNSLKQLHFYDYNREDLEYLLSKIGYPIINHLRIILYQNEQNTELLMNEISYLKKLEKKYPIKIQIHYSKKYKEKNLLKQINLQILKLILVFLITAGIFYFFLMKREEIKEKGHVEELNQMIEQIEENNINNDIIEEPILSDPNTSEEIVDAYHIQYEKVYEKLLSMNSDTIGWITLNNTNINYPVVKSSDNDYYLSHSFDGKKSSFGWIYADYRNQFDHLSQNTIIYGHNVRNTNLMFATLKNALEPSWYEKKENQIITFNTIQKSMKWQIFSIYTILDTNDYLRTDFDNDELFSRYIKQETERSIYNFNVEVNSSDFILTLSTCYKDNTKRLVLHAKLIN